jgi:hypothetical protein
MSYFHGVNMGLAWLCGGGGLEEDLEDFYNILYACSWFLE